MDTFFVNTADAASFLASLALSWKVLIPTAVSLWLVVKVEKQRRSKGTAKSMVLKVSKSAVHPQRG